MIWCQAHPKGVEKRGCLPEDVSMLSMQILQLVHLCLPQTQDGIVLAQRRQLLLGSPCTLLCSTQSSLLLLQFGMELLHLLPQARSL